MKRDSIVIKLFFVFIALLIILIGVAIFKDSRREPYVDTFPDTIMSATSSELPYINIIAKTLAYNVLCMDTASIMITDMPKRLEDKYDAYVLKATPPHTYIIFLSGRVRGRSHLRQVLSHEFAHIQQYESGQLIPLNIDKGIYIWEGDTIDYSVIDYKDRNFEKDAFIKEKLIQSSLFIHLYPKE